MLMKWFIFALFFLIGIQLSSAQSFRTFKDKSGREMEAKLVKVSGSKVSIERKDGLTTQVDISVFGAKDQKYIKDWAKTNLLTSGIFEVRFTTQDSKKRKSESGGVERVQYKSTYGIEVQNSSYESIKNIRIEYLVLKFEDTLAAQKRSEGNYVRIKDKTSIEYLGARSNVTATTKAVPMLETKLDPDYEWANGGKDRSKDVLKGIWVKMYVGDMLVHESSRPESMMRKEAW